MIDTLFPPYDFAIEQSELIDTVLVITARSQMSSALCPDCGTLSSSIHSRYQRTLADLPISGYRVRLCLHVHRFFCSRFSCSRKKNGSKRSGGRAGRDERDSHLWEDRPTSAGSDCGCWKRACHNRDKARCSSESGR